MNDFEILTKSLLENRSSLELAFFEEDEHPRGRGGKFASKGGGGFSGNNPHGGGNRGGGYNSGGGSDEELGYNREEVRSKIKAEDRAKRIHTVLSIAKNVAIGAGIGGLALSGHPILAAAVAGGIASHQMYKAIKRNALRVTTKFATRHLIINPVNKVVHAGTQIGRGVSEAFGGLSHEDLQIKSKQTLRHEEKLNILKNAANSATSKYSKI